jgi:hypothetical protein
VKASEYATFEDDGGSVNTLFEDCVSVGLQARLYGKNCKVRGGYYLEDIFIGSAQTDWYANDVTVEDAYIYGSGPLRIYGNRVVVRNCDLLTTFDDVIGIQWRSDIPRKPIFVLFEGNRIDNAGRLVSHLTINNCEKVILINNHFVGTGGRGVWLFNNPIVYLLDNIFDNPNPVVFDTSWSGRLYARGNKGYDTENFKSTGISVAVGTGGVYGSASAITSPSGVIAYPRVKITWGGTFGTGETVTVKVEAVYSDGSTAYVEKSATAVGSLWLTDDDILALITRGKDIVKLNIYAKTNLSSTTVTVTIDAYGKA